MFIGETSEFHIENLYRTGKYPGPFFRFPLQNPTEAPIEKRAIHQIVENVNHFPNNRIWLTKSLFEGLLFCDFSDPRLFLPHPPKNRSVFRWNCQPFPKYPDLVDKKPIPLFSTKIPTAGSREISGICHLKRNLPPQIIY